MLDGVANVEDGQLSRGVDLSVAARVTGIAAIVLGAAELLSWVASFSMVEPVVAVIGSHGFFLFFEVLWIVMVAATAVAAAGLIVGWRWSRPLWAPGIGLIASGLVLRWGWWLLDRFVDIWNIARFTGADPADPELVWTGQAALLVDVGVSIVVIVLLLWGGRRLLAAARSAG